ncbi:MAG: hypothetical protein AAFV96_06835, partial [Pseudomonadota bacterium]
FRQSLARVSSTRFTPPPKRRSTIGFHHLRRLAMALYLPRSGQLFLYVPWIWRYHAPRSLVFQDYQRLSRDGMAYLLRDFDEVTLYPLRGKYSAIANLLKWWKPMVERRFGGRVNRMLDTRASDWRNTIQTSGFFAEARRPRIENT